MSPLRIRPPSLHGGRMNVVSTHILKDDSAKRGVQRNIEEDRDEHRQEEIPLTSFEKYTTTYI